MTRLMSYSMKAENRPIATTDSVIISALDCRKMFTRPATSSRMAPTNRNLPMFVRSRLITLARLAIATNTTAVPPKAVMISDAPLLKPSTAARMRDSIRPMKNVKPSSTGTPAAEFLVFSIANMKPKAPPRNTMALMPMPRPATMPVCTPIQAPSTVGRSDSASSQ